MKRTCGTCTLCCTLLPVVELKKPANTRCDHARGGGCRVYHKPALPMSCKLWSCRWLIDEDTINLSRPDQIHYVIDAVPDYVMAQEEDGKRTRIAVLQIWVDPKYPDAHRDPALREYLRERGEREGMAALIRYNSRDSMTLFPPALTVERQFREMYDSEIDPNHNQLRIIRSITIEVEVD